MPARVERVYAAGPPASVLAFAVAPDKLLGWTSPFRQHERLFVAARYAELPTLGRLTGRGNTANVEVVLAARPDLIVVFGALSPTYASLADRVQAQTGIPYVLLDGDFDRMADSFEQFGRLVGEERRAADLAAYTRKTIADIGARVTSVPPARRPRVDYSRGPRGLDTGLAGSINAESIERVGAVNVAAELGRGGLVQVSVEQVLRWNPDVVITSDANFYASLRRDPLWRDIAAQVRGPRVLAALAVGAALAAAGATYQSLFRNPLVSPDILGGSSGAAVGAVLGIFLSLGMLAIQGLAFECGLGAVALVYFTAAAVRGHDPLLVLVLAGVVVGALLGAVVALLKYLATRTTSSPRSPFGCSEASRRRTPTT